MDYPRSDASARLYNGKFTDGDPVNSIPPSKDSASYQNMLFDELINVIENAGLTPDETNKSQLSQAINVLASNKTQQLGVGQTWRDMTSTRQANVTYTNTSGQPICVNVNLNNGSTSFGGVLYVDDTLVSHQNPYGIANAGYDTTVSAIVPNGSTYRLNLINSTRIPHWKELRA